MTYPPRPLDAVKAQVDTVRPTERLSASVTTAEPVRTSSRFGQLTYSSFDDGTGIAGGWQVKESTGGLTDAESETLRYWVQTTFDPVTPLPQFPTPEDVATCPRRLMYTTLGDGRAGYWHTAPAGADGSGRPGNVFAHTILDRNIRSSGIALRPIELWRSRDWLTPYGAAEVAGAVLVGHDIPCRADVVNRLSVIDFLCSPDEWRMGVLSVLLDAVAAALDGGPAVVLGTRSVDSAALWIGAVSHLMSAGTARRLNWSTFDRAPGVSISASRGVHLISVPTIDIAAIPPTGSLVIISEDETPSIGDLGGASHRTTAGSVVAVTEWSVMAQGVLIDRVTAQRALEAQDHVAVQLTDSGLHPMWPLAMSIALTGELHDDVGDEAAAVIARNSPERLASMSELLGPASALIDRTLGSTAADCWHKLSAVRPNKSDGYSVAVELIMTVYVDRALRDREWMMQPGGVPFPEVRPRDGWVPARLADHVAAAVADLFARARRAREPVRELAFEALRVFDFLVRSRCIDEPPNPIGEIDRGAPPVASPTAGPRRGPTVLETSQNCAEAAVAPVLLDPTQGPRFVDHFGVLHPLTAMLLVRPVLASSGAFDRGQIGKRVSEVVIDWALPGTLAPPQPRILLEGPTAQPNSHAVFAAEVAYRKLIDTSTAEAWAGFNLLVLWRLLEQSDNPDVQTPDLSPVFRASFDADALIRLLDRYEAVVPPRFFTRMLATSPTTEGLLQLARSVESRRPSGHVAPLAPPDHRDRDAIALAGFRLRTEWSEMRNRERLTLQQRFLQTALREGLQFGPSNMSPDLLHSLAVLGITQSIENPFSTVGFDNVKLAVRAAASADRELLVAAIADLVRPGELRIDSVVISAVVGADNGPDSGVASPPEKFLGRLTRDVDDRKVSLLDEVVELIMEKGKYEGPSDPDALEELLSERVKAAHPRGRDKVLAQHRKFAKKWLDDRGLGAGGLMSRLRRR